ncbi:MAG: cyclase family protein [Brumimicrobium sp.]
MVIKLETGEKVDLSRGIDLSIPVSSNVGPIAWHVENPSFQPVTSENWTGMVEKGGSVNFFDIHFNPHGNGTHTECLGHITSKVYSVNESLKEYFFVSVLISVKPQEKNGDLVITESELSALREYSSMDALIIRTLPNNSSKKSKNYSSTNPPYLDVSCLQILNQLGVKHLLVDLPSVDKENDGGKVEFHHQFWGVPDKPRYDKTITEMIFVPDEVEDGKYLLNLQLAPFELDAAPSRPIIYKFF